MAILPVVGNPGSGEHETLALAAETPGAILQNSDGTTLTPPHIGWQIDFVVEVPLRVSWKLDSVGVRLAPKMAIS
jgi:hypothetical protein